MIEKMNLHYSFTNPASVHDEEALTALELAGRQGAKINEIIDSQNNLVETTPDRIAQEVHNHIEGGTFDNQIDRHTQKVVDAINHQTNEFTRNINDIDNRVDNLVGAVIPGSTSLDAEVIDLRLGADGKTYASAGEAVRSLSTPSVSLTIEAGNFSTDMPDLNYAKCGIYKLLFATGATNIPRNLPFDKWTGGIGTLIVSNPQAKGTEEYVSQTLITTKGVYYRFSAANFDNAGWYNLTDDGSDVMENHTPTIDAGNYASVLPDVNNINETCVYRMLFAEGSTNIPANLPFTQWEGVTATLLNFKGDRDETIYYNTQLLITTKNIYYRYAGEGYTYWINLSMVIRNSVLNPALTVRAGGSILSTLKNAYANGHKKIIVEAGIYDVIADYKNVYGEAFFDLYSNYEGADQFLRGLWVENMEIVFSPGAKVVCHYTGDNTNVVDYFSPFACGNNAIIDGLVLDSSRCRYGIHPDFNHGSDVSTMVIRNCDIKHVKNTSSEQAIGAGFGEHVEWLIENTVFHSTQYCPVVRVHNHVSGDACSRLTVRNCYIDGAGYFLFNSYSTSEKLSQVIVSGCSYASEPVTGHELTNTTPVNIKLYKFANEKRGS